MSFTPGPWSLVAQSNGSHMLVHVHDPDEFKPSMRIIGFVEARRVSFDEDRANARLISAAPDLLAACEAVEELWRRSGPNEPCGAVWPIVHAALAKAKD